MASYQSSWNRRSAQHFSLRMVWRLVVAILVPIVLSSIDTLEHIHHAKASGADILILSTTVTSPNAAGRPKSLEEEEAEALGYTVEVVDAAGWAAKTRADFASYRAIILGDPTCTTGDASLAPAVANETVWGPAVTGNVLLVGTDPTYHSFYGPGNIGSPGSGPYSLIQNAISFAAGAPGATGAYISLSCYYAYALAHTPVPVLDAFSTGGFTVLGTNAAVGCFNDAHIVATHPALAGLTDPDLQNWSCSVHEAFDQWPNTFQVLAIARNVGGSYTARDGSVGTPYILARGTGVTPIQSCAMQGFGGTNLDFLQKGQPWSGDAYGGRDFPLSNGQTVFLPFVDKGNGKDTIGTWGCALTSAAMVVNYFSAQQGSTFRTDPGKLNQWLQHNQGYDSGPPLPNATAPTYVASAFVVWPKIAEYASTMTNGAVRFSFDKLDQQDVKHGETFQQFVTRTNATNNIKSYMCALNPVIVAVGSQIGHWVVATGNQQVNGTDTWGIQDPDPLASFTSTTTLQDEYSNVYSGAAYYSNLPPKPRLTIMAHSPVELILTDPLGRRLGYDPASGTSLHEIPTSSYGPETLAAEDGSGSVLEQTTLDISDPQPGTYSLQVIGTGSGPYSVDAVSVDNTGVGTMSDAGGSILPGSIVTYTVAYSSTPGASGSITPVSTWTLRTSSTTNRLHSIACVNSTTCTAVGDAGTIVATTDGGSSWSTQNSKTQSWLYGVSCPGPTTCIAVGGSGTILRTTDGNTWSRQASGTSNSLWGISCVNATTCYTAGDSGTILMTANGGSTWSALGSGTSSSLRSIACPSTTTCYAAGANGVILASTNGGASWASQVSHTTNYFYSIACPNAATCYASAGNGWLAATTNGGSTWAQQKTHTTNYLWGITCSSVSSCIAVGGNGWIIGTSDGGTTWTQQPSGITTHLRGVTCIGTLPCVAVGDNGVILRRDT